MVNQFNFLEDLEEMTFSDIPLYPIVIHFVPTMKASVSWLSCNPRSDLKREYIPEHTPLILDHIVSLTLTAGFLIPQTPDHHQRATLTDIPKLSSIPRYHLKPISLVNPNQIAKNHDLHSKYKLPRTTLENKDIDRHRQWQTD